MYKYILLFLFLASTAFGQTTGKQLEFNSAWGVDYESNMVKNPSAAKNLNNTLKLGATLSRDTSSGNKIDGKASFLLDASALNDYLELSLHTPNDEQTSGNCGFKGLFKGDATLYRAQILDGSGNVLAQTVPLTNETGFREFRVWYPCGASGARKVRITQTEAGTAPAINVGKFYYGRMEPGAGTSPNTFSAKVSATGIVSNVTPPGWLTNFSVTGIDFTGTTFKSGLFTQKPNCTAVVDTASGANFTYSIRIYNTTTSTISVSSNTADTTTAAPFTISCTKTGSDYVQPAITPDNADFTNLFSARVEITTGSSNLGGSSDWVSCTAASPSVCTFKSGLFSVSPNCGAESLSTSAANTVSVSGTGTTSRTVYFNGGSVANLICTRAGSDFRPSAATPLLLGSVTSNAVSALRTEYVTIVPTSNVVCTTNSSSSSWVTASTPTAAGDCTITFTGAFSATPFCVAQSNMSSGGLTTIMSSVRIVSVSSTSLRILHSYADDSAGTISAIVNASNEAVVVMCIGPR